MIQPDEVRELGSFFKQITGFMPYGQYQLQPAIHVANSQNVVLRMPTGSGKSESLLVAYLWALKENLDFPQQAIYGLPMRNLVNMLGERFARYQKNYSGLSVAIQHGTAPGTPKFYSDIAIATIDQIISAYACTPFGISVRMGNIPAGAIASAFLAFDEVHTFDPKRALQSTLFILESSHKLGIPFAILSATIPDAFAEILERDFSVVVVDVEENEIPVRMARQVVLVNRLTEHLTSQQVLDSLAETEGSVLVVCNTVERAKTLWHEVNSVIPETLLLHSQFSRVDRDNNEKRIADFIGKNPSRRGVVITTQVVEVGLDVSTSLLLTELSPIDSVIQRAGRVARWGGHGEIRVYNVENSAPYQNDLVENTRAALTQQEILLDWKSEQNLVNQVLNDPFRNYLIPEHRGQAVYHLSEGSSTGRRDDVAKAIRSQDSCTVTIHHSPNELARNVWQLPQIPIFIGTLKRFVNSRGTEGIWRVVVDEGADMDSEDRWSVGCLPLRIVEEIKPNNLYVLSPGYARYEPQGRGLVLGEINEDSFKPLEGVGKQRKNFGQLRRESWVLHSSEVLDCFFSTFLPRYEGVLARLSRRWKASTDEFVDRIAFTIALHDLGKLNQEWQRKIGRRPGEPPLAHSGAESAHSKLPPHATISAYCAADLFVAKWGRKASEPLLCAIAHHHSVRATNLPAFALINEWPKEVEALFANYPTLLSLWDKQQVSALSTLTTPTELQPKEIDLTDDRAWRTYATLSRILRLSDQMATGGSEYVLLRDEDWLTDV